MRLSRNPILNRAAGNIDTISKFLLYFLYPLWLVVGVADYLCHRLTRIEHTSGLPESMFHLAQFGQIGLPLLAGLLLELNASMLLLMLLAALAHTLTERWPQKSGQRHKWTICS
jgi:hypothetical protein